MWVSELDPEAKVALTDSRFLSKPDSSIFFAIKGERHDGHQFIPELYDKGIREFVVEKRAFNEKLKGILEKEEVKALLVDSSILTLQEMAGKNRQKYDHPVIGITGSNGKTIVKEWLNALLDKDFDIVKSPRSYNSQIGVALSVWEMSSRYQLGIFEAGISLPGEMKALQKIIQPTIGVFTNIGSSHSEGFESDRQKIREKLQLFVKSETLIYCRDYSEIEEEVNAFLLEQNPNLKIVSWSKADVEVKDGKAYFLWKGEKYELPFIDAASVENLVHCILAALSVKEDWDVRRLRFLNPVEMRLELKEGREDNYIIDDTYNNDLGGLKMALQFMSQAHTLRGKVLILSDMFQTGLEGESLSRVMQDLIAPQGLNTFIGVGEHWKKYPIHLSGVETQYYDDTKALLTSGALERIKSSLILVKGARIFAFEKIVEKLIKRNHGTVLEINLDAITHNLNYYRRQLGSSTKIMVMVKAFAYGSGNEVAAWLQYHRVDYLTVAFPDEGVALRENGISLPIMVMNSDPDSYSTIFEYGLEPEIYSFRVLEAYLKAKENWKPDELTKIHLKIDTGMHRLGFLEKEVPPLLKALEDHPKVQVASIFSHLVGADEAKHDAFSKEQIACYERASSAIINGLGYSPIRHICNTAGIIRFPEARYDMSRLGIGLYGVASSGLEQKDLQTVATLKTTISQIKVLDPKETVGYGRYGVLNRESKIATIAIGYADGYDRGFGRGNAFVLVHGKACPTMGSICMDMCMIDVTDVDCKEGDEVIVFGENPSLTELAEKINTIPYEILTGISSRVKRVFYHA
ncbi:alanine racemase [Leadbetterella byssophila DSM 17132]|uniref:Alanine racemase n=1 Tax=Leadbetterella byssophila (strain DSM 17132 / JCM 16389 / KACC 11308 / NBRC 106382 / 4M15) TaxID=649349 RepID=E4RY60_LEAB4|nr:bifunctional UDP-N-acetylmuramoyl-tripeptide:D-alanyl-D-alanine ligase/alanine racemase [Leadbetterella byssophila]ADQ17271.1 alanine racemase [Leadbetterella byssophila DSM 17132]